MLYHEARTSAPTLAGRLVELGEELRQLGARLKGEVARLVAEAVARAVRDALRKLLGADIEEAWDAYQRPEEPELEDAPWQEQLWEEDVPPAPPGPAPAPSKRWRRALGAALEAGLWWLGRQPRQRPLLTTAAVALAAGAAALFAGPALGACAGALASAAGLLLAVGGGD